MRTFTFRITCRFAILVTATTAVVLTIGGVLLDRQIERGLELLHDIEVRELAELIGPDEKLTSEGISNRIKHDADSDAALFVMQVADLKGNILFRSDNLGETILSVSTMPDQHETVTVPFLGRVHMSVYATGPWRIHIGSPLEPSERLMHDYARMCLPLLFGVGLVSVGLGYAFSRATLRPIRAIETTARRIRADNLAERIPEPAGRDELTSLTQLLNQTFDRLEASFEQVRRFAADASHELKTPLALIRLNVEKVRSRLPADGESTAALGDVLEEIGRMHQVVDRLLFLAQAESGALPLALRTIDLPVFIATLAEDAQALAEDRGVRFEVARNEAGVVQADPELLRQLLLNLVANAVTASPAGGRVQIDSFATDAQWTFTITDEGPGIPVIELPRIFGRFFQVTPRAAALESRRGHGLGLAICKSIAELHGGRIGAENRPDRPGLRVSVVLPRVPMD